MLSTARSRVLVVVLSACSCMIGMLAVVFATATPGDIDSLFIMVGGALFGIGSTVLILQWGAIYSLDRPRRALLHTTLASVVAVVVYALVAFTPLSGLVAEVAFVLTAVSAIPLVQESIPLGPINHDDEPLRMNEAVGTLLKAVWRPLTGALIAVFILGLVFDPEASGEITIRATQTQWRFVIGPLIASALILILLIKSPRMFVLHHIDEVLLPIAILLILIIPFVMGDDPVVNNIAGTVNEFAFMTVGVVTWVCLTTAVRTTNLSPQIVFTVPALLAALVAAVGMRIINWIGTDGKVLCLILTAVYLIILILCYTLTSRNEQPSKELQHTILERYFEQRCAEMSTRYHLSERESEVLRYLSRGYSQVYIAKALYVSENTVRTHTRHIYTKMDISSREELIELFDR